MTDEFQPLNTADHTTQYRKVLLYAMHGWGKTHQAKNYKRKYGNGLILSGESGLSSIRSAGVDYFPFSSWDGAVDPKKNIFSFRALLRWIKTDAFLAKQYQWIMVDSLTELSDLAYAAAETEASLPANLTKEGKVNNFMIWDIYASKMIGACKMIRDLPMHVIVTALAKRGEDDNGNEDCWPMVKGKQVQTQLPGIFDCVFCGLKRTEQDLSNPNSRPETVRYIITDEYKGWHGKARDEKRRLKAVEREHDLTKLFDKMEMPDSDYEAIISNRTTN